MRAKNVVPLVIFVFVLSGFLVNSVFAMPTDPQKEFVRDESKFESKLSSVQEDLEPVEYSTHSIYYEENDRTLDLLDDFVPPPQVDNSRDSSFTSHNSFELSSAAVDLLENTVQGSSPWQQLNEDGFGGTNYLIPAVQEFNGYLYAGTWKSDGYGSAEVWRTDDGSSWQLVDERPRNGCADLVVFGTYLYCGDWNGVIWRTSDGEIWEEVITDGFGDASNGIARFAVFDGKLYAGTWNGASAQIWRTNNGTDWTIFGNGLDPDNIVGGAISTEIFGGYLYWGTGNWETGAQLWRTDGTLLEQMTTGTSPAISSLAAFDGYLYAGVWDATSTQVWRSADGSGWTHMLTFSDLGSGIREENGLEVYDGMLYLVGANPDTGLEVWRTGNGTNWEQVGFAGFGDTSNERSYWDNAITTFGGKLIISTNNYNTGGEVWAYAPNDYEVYDVGMWLNLGVNDWLWGNAIPGSNVTIETPRETINSYADPGCNGCWGIDVPIELNPGDTITITAEPGSYPVDFTIPTPLVSIADSSTDTVSGEIGGWNSQTVTIHSGWDNGDQEVTTDASGNFSATYTDIPRGGEGYIHFATVDDGADINYHQYFRTPDLIMEIRTDYDQIEGQYAPGHSIVLTVKDGDDNIKAHTTIETTEIEEWGGQTGFATWMDGVSWMPSPPDIVSGDKIYGSVDGGNYETYSQVGDITGVVNVDTDSISGTINAPWLIPDPGLVDVECYAWGAPDGAPDKHSSVIPDGNPANTYTCFWDPFTEWDVEVNQWIGVAYRDPQSNKIIEEFYEPDYNLYLNVNYDHDWIEGSYPSGYDVTLWVTDSEGDEKARTTITTGHLPWLGTGFSTTTEGVVWDPEQPDIHPGDWVYGQVTVGDTTYNVQVRLGTISGTLEAESDSFTGYVSVPWLPQDMEVPVQVHPWGAPEGTSSCESSVLPNGTDPFTCDWTTEWDVQPGQQIAALYMDPAEHWVYSVHTAYTDELILQVHYDHEWISGSYEAGHDIHLQVLDESLIEKAHIDLISGYVYGWGSTTGFYTNMEGAHWVPGWPDMQPGDTIHGEVDGGLEFTTDVKIGTITGDLDLTNEQISGTVDVPWRLPEPIDIGCYIWENDSPGNKYVNADPVADVYPYSCSWDGEYDIQPDTDVMVAYFELAGHEVIGDFSYPSSRLQIDKWLESGDPGVGGNVTFNIQYFNDGKGTAVNTNITDTFGEGLTYISDTSGITPSVDGDTVTWALNDLAPGGDRVNFYVFAQVTAAEGATITNTATISSDTFDSGNLEDRTRTWTGTVIANDTHLNVSKDTWTWNPVPGQEFVYSVNVCNNGPTGSTELILTDTLPDAVTFVDSWGGYAGWEEVSLVEQTLTLMYPSIPGWSCRDVYMQVSLSPDAQVNDELINTAVISADNDDPDEEDNQTWLSHNVSEPYIDLSVDLNWHWGSLVPGGQYRYGIYFRNNGNMLVPGQIAVSTTLPTGTSFAGWDHWEWANIIGDPEVVGNTVTWQVGDLGAGYSGAIEVYVNIDAGVLPETELLHSAGIEVQVDEEDTENNSAGFSEIVRDHGPNLRISKWGDWHGDSRNAWYSLRVENIGDETVEDVLITDILPAEMELDGGIGVNYGEPFEVNTYEDYFTVTLDRLEPGWNPEINFNTRIPEEMPIELGTVFTNTASVSPTEYDIYVEDNSTSFDLTYTSGSRPYLHIDKWMTSGEPGVGGNATFHVQYINQGGAVATGVELTDVLVGMTYISDTSGITPTVNVSGSEIAWEIGDLEPGDWIGFEVFVEIDYALDELLQNTIEITTTSLYLDGDPSERSSYWEGNVLENATQLSIGKSPWTENPAPGETFIYQISVCNNGQTASSDVTLTETLPANTTFVNWIGTEPGWTETSQSGQTLELENPTISAGSCYGVYVEVLLDPEAQPGDLITNTATISSSSDLSQGDDTATYNHYVGEPYADLAIWANFNWGSLTPGGHYRSILQFRNQGNLGVTSSENIYVTATLPAGTSFAGWDKWDWGTVGEPTVTAETVSWLVTDLDPGAWSTIELWLDINSETAIGTELVNEVSITEKIGETYTENNYAIYAEFVWAHGPNPRIRKWGDWHSYGDGHNAWYHIQVENIGDQTVDGVLITDDLPTGMVLDGDVGVGFWEYSEVTDYGNYFTVFLDRLEPGWNVGMDFNVVIPGEDPVLWGQVFTNTATITEDPTETNPEDNSAEFVLGTGTDMFVEKTWLNGEILPGEQVEFLLEFGNKQPGHTPWWGMTGNAILVDTLPEGMSFVSSYWHCYQEEEWCELIPEQDGQTLTWSTWPLGPGVSHVMVLTVLIDEEIQEGNTLVNTFEISSDQPTVDIDPFMENNTSTYDPGVNFVAPTITSANSTTFTVGSLGSFTFTSSGSPTSQITYTGTLPVGVGFVDNGDGTAKLEGTPATGTEGVYELTITASNGVLPEDTQTFTLTVVPAPAAPIITRPAITNFKVGIPGSFTVTATGNPSPTFSYTGSLPDGVTLTSAGLLSGTAAEGTGGVYSLTITASNGVDPDDTQSFTLVVSEAPEFTSEDNTTFTAGMLGSFTITTSGYPKPAITTGDALPAWLSLVDQGDGTAILSGTPPDENGVDYILLNADNGVTPDAEQNFTLTWEKSSGLMLYLPLILK